jgi:hypothetical protein
MNLETLKNVLLCPPFYVICPPFQEAPSGNPRLECSYVSGDFVGQIADNFIYGLHSIDRSSEMFDGQVLED